MEIAIRRLAVSTGVIKVDPRKRLGEVIRAARARAGMSIHEAATHAGMSPTTWGRIERGEDISVRAQTYSAIEQVAGWEPGSITRILGGGDPIPARTDPNRRGAPDTRKVDHIAEWEAAMIDEIWATSTLSDDLKEELSARVRAKAAEGRVIEDRLRRSAS